MKSYWFRVGSISSVSGVLLPSEEEIDTGEDMRMQADWSDVSASQGTSRITSTHRKLGESLGIDSASGSRKNPPRQQQRLHFGLRTSGTVEE